MTQIVHAINAPQIVQARALLIEYEASVDFKECFVNFEREVEQLPGEYASPRGRLLLAVCDAEVAGCVALKPVDDRICEMKRLFARPQFRRRGIGRSLTETVIDEARRIGYARLRLDSLASMKEALALYRSLGFKQTTPYLDSPHDDEVFMELELGR